MKQFSAGPQRMCVGCRERADKVVLVRVVIRDGRLQVDPNSTEPGRGAYLHLRDECIELAERRKAVARALRTDVACSLDAVRQLLTNEGSNNPS